MSNDRDYKGVLVIDYTLKKLNSKYKYFVFVTEQVSDKKKKILLDNNINLINVNFTDILSKYTDNKQFIEKIINKWYYTKFLIFSLEYEKIVYLDTDLLILENIDHLFDLELTNGTLYMVYDIQVGSLNDNKIVIFTENGYNSGVIVFKPSIDVFNKLYCELINVGIDEFDKLHSDQSIFNLLINNNYLTYKNLDMKYNIPPVLVYDFLYYKFFDKPYIIHFMLKPKPWDLLDFTETISFYNKTTQQYFKQWINTYFEMCLIKYKENIGIENNEKLYSNKYCYGLSKDNKIVVKLYK